jgi:hypothetical protein
VERLEVLREGGQDSDSISRSFNAAAVELDAKPKWDLAKRAGIEFKDGTWAALSKQLQPDWLNPVFKYLAASPLAPTAHKPLLLFLLEHGAGMELARALENASGPASILREALGDRDAESERFWLINYSALDLEASKLMRRVRKIQEQEQKTQTQRPGPTNAIMQAEGRVGLLLERFMAICNAEDSSPSAVELVRTVMRPQVEGLVEALYGTLVVDDFKDSQSVSRYIALASLCGGKHQDDAAELLVAWVAKKVDQQQSLDELDELYDLLFDLADGTQSNPLIGEMLQLKWTRLAGILYPAAEANPARWAKGVEALGALLRGTGLKE